MRSTTWSWPTGVRAALALTFDFDAEEVWLYKGQRYVNRPAAVSQGSYGANIAIPALLRVLERHGVSATFFTPGRVAETHPDRVREILAGGHTIGYHGYTHDSPSDMSETEEDEQLTRGIDVLNGLGAEVRGFRSPSMDISPNTLKLVAKHGLTWSSNFMGDVRPYCHPDTGIVELPTHWMLDDAAFFWFSGGEDTWPSRIAPASEVREIWEQELLGIARLEGACILIMHPQVIGRPSRLLFLDAYLSWAAAQDGIWVASCEEIVARVKPAQV